MRCPCTKECKERRAGCHATCEKGKEWEAWNRERREAVKRAKEADVFRAIRARIQKRRMNEYER